MYSPGTELRQGEVQGSFTSASLRFRMTRGRGLGWKQREGSRKKQMMRCAQDNRYR